MEWKATLGLALLAVSPEDAAGCAGRERAGHSEGVGRGTVSSFNSFGERVRAQCDAHIGRQSPQG